MKLFRIIAIFIVVSFFSFQAHAQNSPNDPSSQKVLTQSVIPRSPETASLGKFGDVPVSNFTGIPNISIPIFSFNIFGKTFPISLNYHAGGIKVDEVASNVGLGWSLMAGGVISSSIQGRSDFDANGFVRPDRFVNKNFNPDFFNNNTDYQIAKEMYEGNLDGEPDIYSYSFLGNSGKFVFSHNGQPHLIPNNTKLKISNNSQGGFTIIDEDGTRFNFNQIEFITNLSDLAQCPGNIASTSISPSVSWYLSSINYLNGEIINLEYENYSYDIKNRPLEVAYYPYPNNYFCNSISPNPKVCNSTSHFTTPRIKRISHKNLVVNFNYSVNNRLDLYGSKALQSITVVNEYKTLHTWTLNHDYFTSGIPESSLPQIEKDTYYKLRLLSIQESGKAPYSFTYYQDTPFPNRLSNSQDYWGYYNNANGGPETGLPTINNSPIGFITGRDRSVHEGVAKLGTLKRIIYPTGGFNEFDYESNSYNKGCVTERVLTSNSVGVVADYNVPSNQASFVKTAGTLNIKASYSQGSSSTQFGASLILRGPNNYQASFTGDSPAGGVDIIGLENGTYTLFASTVEENYGAYLTISWEEESFIEDCSNKLAGGIRIKQISSISNNVESIPNVKKFIYTNIEDASKSSGFLTIPPTLGETQLYPRLIDNNGYQYYDSTNPCRYYAVSSNSNTPLGNIQGSNVGYEFVTIQELNGSEVNGQSVFKYSIFDDVGNPSVYPYAPQTSYDFIRGLLLEQTDFKSVNVNELQIVRKIVNEYNIYTNPNPSSLFEYEINPNINETNILGIKVGSFAPERNQNTFEVVPAQFEFSFFKFISAWYNLKSSTIVDYNNQNVNQYLTTLINYYYDNPTHLQLTKKQIINSKGESILTIITYPNDYLNGTSFINDLIAANNINKPIEEITFQNKSGQFEILSGRIREYYTGGKGLLSNIFEFENSAPVNLSNYKFSNSSSSGLLPNYNSLSNYSKDSQYKLRTVLQYNPTAKLINLTSNEVANTSYLYSYNNQYAIAEIKNMSYATVASILGSTAIDNFGLLANPSKTDIDNFLQPLRNVLPKDVELTSYSYEPLVGIKTMTDTKLMTTYYEYDAQQRLTTIKDQDGNIIKHNTYNYANQ